MRARERAHTHTRKRGNLPSAGSSPRLLQWLGPETWNSICIFHVETGSGVEQLDSNWYSFMGCWHGGGLTCCVPM